jgi:hypothetical protein
MMVWFSLSSLVDLNHTWLACKYTCTFLHVMRLFFDLGQLTSIMSHKSTRLCVSRQPHARGTHEGFWYISSSLAKPSPGSITLAASVVVINRLGKTSDSRFHNVCVLIPWSSASGCFEAPNIRTTKVAQ